MVHEEDRRWYWLTSYGIILYKIGIHDQRLWNRYITSTYSTEDLWSTPSSNKIVHLSPSKKYFRTTIHTKLTHFDDGSLVGKLRCVRKYEMQHKSELFDCAYDSLIYCCNLWMQPVEACVFLLQMLSVIRVPMSYDNDSLVHTAAPALNDTWRVFGSATRVTRVSSDNVNIAAEHQEPAGVMSQLGNTSGPPVYSEYKCPCGGLWCRMWQFSIFIGNRHKQKLLTSDGAWTKTVCPW